MGDILNIYNSKTKSKEIFKPIEEGKITMYVCGPTLYGHIHIGNARPIVFFDVVYKYFKRIGYEVQYVSNITDIDDKIINKARELNITEAELINKNTKEYERVLTALNIQEIYRPTVTKYMQEIITFIDELIKKDYAYKTETGDVYFRVKKIKSYGNISNRKIEDMLSGIRIDLDKYKEEDVDFALWKNTDIGIVWDAPFGKGRPGWHTECAVMIRNIFGRSIDIHGGGNDLKFPHHENENAQYEAMYGQNIANTWMHNGFVNIDGEKMSKSLGNFITVKKMLEQYNSNTIRLLLLQTNYRQPLNLSDTFIEQTQKLLKKIEDYSLEVTLKEKDVYIESEIRQEIKEVMEDDFNTPNLISLLIESIKQKDEQLYVQIIDILGLVVDFSIDSIDLPLNIQKLIAEFKQVREDKNFERSDIIKSEIETSGYKVYVTRSGIKIKEEV